METSSIVTLSFFAGVFVGTIFGAWYISREEREEREDLECFLRLMAEQQEAERVYMVTKFRRASMGLSTRQDLPKNTTQKPDATGPLHAPPPGGTKVNK